MMDLEKRFQSLVDNVKKNDPYANLEKLKKAWAFAKLAHTGQKRFSGDPFIVHPLTVAETLALWRLDTETIIAGLLHDSIEDGGATKEDIVKDFGEGIYLLVDGVTTVGNLRLQGTASSIFVENLRKMIIVMAKDLRVVFVKLADRLHNMETLTALPASKQVEKAKETLEIYAPLAERLGMGEVKGRLEDLAFPYVYPDEYKWVFENSRPYYKEVDKKIHRMKSVIAKKLSEEKIPASIHGRSKHLYSLWRKLLRKEVNRDFSKVYDIVALRIITDSITHCYAALGVVHSLYKPVPYPGVSDFIAQPKPNGYQSIHTKVFAPGGHIAEIQIRTREMHEQAEYGLASHWLYSEKKGKEVSDEKLQKGLGWQDKKLSWVKELVAWQKELTDSKEFLKAVKVEVLAKRNFVFSPKGDVFDLPEGATPVDFAYAVHTDLGKYISGAKVDGKIVPLDYKLKSGQVVEIIKSKKERRPSPRWLNFVVTREAKKEIAKSLRYN
jgi:GTP pyrophosphokinase